MSMVDRLIKQLAERGLSVLPGDEPGGLKLHGPHAEKTPDVMNAVKAFKPQLLERFGVPPLATPDVSDEARPDTVVTDPNPPAPRPEAGPITCPTCDADIYPAATRADIAQLCDRAPCHYLTPELWRGHHGRS